VVNSSYSAWEPVASGVPEVSTPFNVFLSDLENVTECTVVRFADDAILG